MLLGASWLCTSKAAAAPAQPEGDNDRPRGLRRMVTASAAGEDMDESSLLDLLESSVCLERLDTTAKVLRCQHTFCRCCLESIVCSRQELRCPECRALVGCGVEELPANILLVSLLDGIRQRPRAVPDSGLASELSGVGSSTAGSAPGLSGFSMEAGSLRELAASRSVPLAKSPSKLPYGKALYSYEGKETGDLKFNKGDVIILWRRVDNHWFHGELGGTHGFLPASYVQCLQPLPPALPQGKALYDFEMKDQDQDKDCLIFTKLNDSAKELMEMDKLCPAAVSGCHASLPSDPSTVASMAPRPTLSNTRAVSAFQQHEDSKKNAKKCHSFNKFSVIHRSSQATSHRHSMEIGAPVLISSSDPWAAAKIKDLTHLSCSAPAQDSSRARSNPVAEQHCMAPKAQLSFNMYLALYAYKPQKNDELELHKGEMYHVLEKCQDGWFKGTSVRSELSGVFPGNYMMPASRAPLEGSGPPWNKVVGGSPLAKGIATTIHPSGGSLSIPARAMRPVLPLSTAQVQHQAASPPVGSCLWHSAQPMESQAQNTTPTAAHSSALAQDQPTTTVVPLHTQNSPSCLSIASLRPHPVVLPQHLQQPPMQTITEAQCIRPTIPLMSATSAVTPPNVTAANLNGDTGAGTVSGPSTSSPTNMKCKPDEKKTEKKEKKSGLLKLLAGASTKKSS